MTVKVSILPGIIFIVTKIPYKITALLVCILYFSFPFCYAQSPDISFEYLTVEQGLSNFSINDIVQDSQGFLWISTEDGLNKYDGYEFKIYKDEQPNLLPNSSISYLYVDHSNNLWVLSANRLYRYNPNTDGFESLENYFKNIEEISNKVIKRILQDREDNYWIGTSEGLYWYQPNLKQLKLFRYNPDNSYSISNDNIEIIYEDRSGNIWVGTNNGLNRYDRHTGSFIRFQNIPGNIQSLSNNLVLAIQEDRRNILWIGTGKGLSRYDSKTATVIPWNHPSDKKHSLKEDLIFDLMEDREGTLWVGTFHTGLWRYREETDDFISYQNIPCERYTLLNNRVQCIFEDRSGVIWLGHYRAGLSRFTHMQYQFRHYRMEDAVFAICRDRDGNVWIGTESSGLKEYNKEGKLAAQYRHDPHNQATISSDQILSLCENKDGGIWIGTGAGLNYFDKGNRKFIRYKYDVTDPAKPEQYSVKVIREYNGEVWLGTMGSGLYHFDQEKKIFRQYRNEADNPQSLSYDNVWSICQDPISPEYLWIGTFGGGLNRLNTTTNTFTRYTSEAANSHVRSHNGIYSVYPDEKGFIWAGTFGGGLYKLDIRKNSFTQYTDKDGLADNFVKGILKDNYGNLWLSTDKGLNRFNPERGEFKTFTVKDGLISNVLLSGSYYKDQNSQMYFGGENGVVSFNPANLPRNKYHPPVVITNFKVFDKSLFGNSSLSGEKPEKISSGINLSYQDNFFSIEFASLDYNEPDKNHYAYRLEGFDRDWIYCGTRRYASYTDIDPGEYIFHVKGSNNEGLWNEQGALLKISITPPFWQEWWFRGLSVLFLISIILSVYKARVKNLENKKKTLEIQIKEKTQAAEALQTALTEVEQLKNKLYAENIYLQNEIKLEHNFTEIISQSTALQKILHKVEQVANTEATVLIMGESGTGKELLARAIHNLSPRRESPLVKVNCAALPANLIESELFGHEKGAFTGAITRKVGRFELADGGTIFLDEIGELPLELQPKLLRVLQDSEFEYVGGQKTEKVDIRIIAATNRDLKSETQNGRFREDLYYRLNVFPINIPPLRERKEDIPLLVNHFIKKYCAKTGKQIETVSQNTLESLQCYSWPGNVRELENVIEHAVIVSQGKELKLDDPLPQSRTNLESTTTLQLEDVERKHILKVLELTGWRISGEKGAAKVLNINASTLRSRMEKLGIKRNS